MYLGEGSKYNTDRGRVAEHVRLTPRPPAQGSGGNFHGRTSSGFSQPQEERIYRAAELSLGTVGDNVIM